MPKYSHKKSTAPALDDLINDARLTRLFSKDDRHCALQLWILQVKFGQFVENRILYGRLLPYSYSSNSWSASDDDNFKTFGQFQAQVIRLNLYVKSAYCPDLLRQMSAGQPISLISERLQISLSDRLRARFGTVALTADDLVYRPVTYLLNRDAYDRHSPSSPHGGAGALSASIMQIDKKALLRLGPDYEAAFAASIVESLNADTGLDFGRVDASRFGDLELLVFPALNDLEQQLLSVSWTNAPSALVAQFNPMQVPHFTGFVFRLCIENGGQVAYSGLATAVRNVAGIFECKFELDDQLRSRTDGTELDIYGLCNDHSIEGSLCCRWRIGYVREINFQTHLLNHNSSPVKFDWLERTTRQSMSGRVKAALAVSRSNEGFTNRIGSREMDPWVPVNRDFVSLLAQVYPAKSEGEFFLRWSHDGEGRLEFVEWFRKLLVKYKQQQIVIFDPYFEDAGLGLLVLSAAPEADYIVFTSLPKRKEVEVGVEEINSHSTTSDRINNLVASCERNHSRLKDIKLRIYGIKEGRLHDRYILIMGQNGLAITGFNLSNSFQKAAGNYPLLVAPIPADVLLKVERYKSQLMVETAAAQSEGETGKDSMQLLFDSAALPKPPRRYEPLRFLEGRQAGDVLSAWIGEPALQGLSGDLLKERMGALGLLKDDSLILPEATGLNKCLGQHLDDFTRFTATWEVLGEMLAHSPAGDGSFRELESEHRCLNLLAKFLVASFNRTCGDVDKELAVVEPTLFRDPADVLLHSSYRPHHLFHPTKYTALTWSEYFAVKFLWWYSPDVLLTLAETHAAVVPSEPQSLDTVRISLLSQIVSEIALSVQFGLSEAQRNRLVSSRNGLMRWMGLHALEMQLEAPGGHASAKRLVSIFSYPEQVQVLGWMINRAAKNSQKADIYKGLIATLHETLPAIIPANVLKCTVDSMRGHMKYLPWTEPWLFQDILFPLLQSDRANFDDACELWVQELTTLLASDLKSRRLFEQTREGQTINIAAFLFSQSSAARQQACLDSMQPILKRQQQIVQQPLASTSNWNRWNDALTILMWLLLFTRWCQYYMRERGMTHRILEELSQRVRELVMIRPMNEWPSENGDEKSALVSFLDQVDGLLAPTAKIHTT